MFSATVVCGCTSQAPLHQLLSAQVYHGKKHVKTNSMSKQIAGLLFTSCAILVTVIAPAAAPAQDLPAFADTALYERVIERLFRSEAPARLGEVRLRYTSSDEGEMQISIWRQHQNPIQVQLWLLPEGAPTVWRQLGTFWRRDRAITTEEAARRITIKHISTSIPPTGELARILSARPVTARLDDGDLLILEAASYQLFVSSLSKTVMLAVQGPQDWRRSKDQVVRWMGQVRSAVRHLEETR